MTSSFLSLALLLSCIQLLTQHPHLEVPWAFKFTVSNNSRLPAHSLLPLSYLITGNVTAIQLSWTSGKQSWHLSIAHTPHSGVQWILLTPPWKDISNLTTCHSLSNKNHTSPLMVWLESFKFGLPASAPAPLKSSSKQLPFLKMCNYHFHFPSEHSGGFSSKS